MHVVTRLAQVIATPTVDQLRLVATAKKMTPFLMAPVEPLRVGPEPPFHPKSQVSLRRFHHQVKMITHQTIGMDLPSHLCAGFAQGAQKRIAIGVVEENRFRRSPRLIA
jgi:hypothetical protein